MSTKAMETIAEVEVVDVVKAKEEEGEDCSTEDAFKTNTTASTTGRMTT